MNMPNNWLEAAEAQLSGKDLSQDQENSIVELLELCVDDPEKALKIISGVIELDPQEGTLNYLGAGPIEDLLVHNCVYIPILIEKAKIDNRYRQCLAHVNLEQDDCPDANVLQDYLKR